MLCTVNLCYLRSSQLRCGAEEKHLTPILSLALARTHTTGAVSDFIQRSPRSFLSRRVVLYQPLSLSAQEFLFASPSLLPPSLPACLPACPLFLSLALSFCRGTHIPCFCLHYSTQGTVRVYALFLFGLLPFVRVRYLGVSVLTIVDLFLCLLCPFDLVDCFAVCSLPKA